MTIGEQLQYARYRASGASAFAKDKIEAQRWADAVRELEELKLRIENENFINGVAPKEIRIWHTYYDFGFVQLLEWSGNGQIKKRSKYEQNQQGDI